MKVAFLDRDGVINRFPGNGNYVTRVKDFRFIPGSLRAIRQLSEAPSDSHATDEDSPEVDASSPSSTREEEARIADHEPEAPERSWEVRQEMKTPERNSLKLKDYLGEAGMARFLAQRDERRASDDDSGESPPAGERHDEALSPNEANLFGKEPAAGLAQHQFAKTKPTLYPVSQEVTNLTSASSKLEVKTQMRREPGEGPLPEMNSRELLKPSK